MPRGRKKKTPVVSAEKKDSLVYKGNVTIKKLIGNSVYKKDKIHNKGTEEFFRLILLAIAGENVSSSMPNYIHTFFKDTSGDFQSTCVTNIPLYNKTISYKNNAYELSLEFLIPFSQFYPNTTTNSIKLYGSSNFTAQSKALAEIELPADKVFVSDGITNIQVIWTLSIKNTT